MSSVVPEGWAEEKLGNVSAIIDPHPSHRAPPEVNGGIPFLGIGDLKENGDIDTSKVRLVAREEILEHEKRYRISENTIGFGRVASIGKIVDFRKEKRDVLISPTLAVIEPHSVQKKYLVNYLKSQLIADQLDFFITGSTRSSLGIQLLRELSILLPPLPEQKKIASILTSVDEVIENTQKQIDKLQDLKKATMNELLTKGIGHTEFKDSELGRIPKSWEVATLESVSSFRRGSFPQPYGNPEWYDDNGFPFVQVFDIAFNRRLKTSTKVKISKKAADMSVFIPAGSLLVSLQGSIGRVAVTQYDAYVDRTVLIFSKYESSLERFFFSIMIEELFRRQKDVADGGIIKTITKETLRSFEITVPPLSEQRKIGVTIQSIEGSISKHESKLAQTQSLKKSLMQDLLTGKVRVTVN